jgi:hypothetical protein
MGLEPVTAEVKKSEPDGSLKHICEVRGVKFKYLVYYYF